MIENRLLVIESSENVPCSRAPELGNESHRVDGHTEAQNPIPIFLRFLCFFAAEASSEVLFVSVQRHCFPEPVAA